MIRIETGAQTVSRALQRTAAAHDFDEIESRHAILEKIQLIRAESGKRLRHAVVRGGAAHAGIRRLRLVLGHQRECLQYTCDEKAIQGGRPDGAIEFHMFPLELYQLHK